MARVTILRTRSDECLAELVREGSAAAFEAIVHRYRRQLLRHCARVVGDTDAEEAVQDALINAYAVLDSGSSVRSLPPWLHAVAHNAALGILRRRTARPECPQEQCAERLRAASPEPGGAELEDVVRAVRSLPPRQRDAIVMRELEGRSYDEIGARLGASGGAVRQLLNRARRSLRETVGALIPAAPLLGSGLCAGDGAGAGGALTLVGGSSLAAKLTGAAILSAVSVIALMPSPRGPANGDRAGWASGPGPPPVAALITPSRLPVTTGASVLGDRSVGTGRSARLTLQPRALVAHRAPSAGPQSTTLPRRSPGSGARAGGKELRSYATAGRVNFGPGREQSSTPSPTPRTPGSGAGRQAPASEVQRSARQAGAYTGGTGAMGQRPAGGPVG